VGLGNADERGGFGFLKADAQVLDTHAGVDEDDDDTKLEKGKRKGVELQTRRHHQDRAHAAAQADLFQTEGEAIGLAVEFMKREVAVRKTALVEFADRLHNGERLRLPLSHPWYVSGDVVHEGVLRREWQKCSRDIGSGMI
jgi:hypothetical protein